MKNSYWRNQIISKEVTDYGDVFHDSDKVVKSDEAIDLDDDDQRYDEFTEAKVRT